MIKKGYTDGPNGQLHWRMLTPETVSAPDLYCFHPAPFSGLAYTGIMPYLAKNRRVIAPDYPGYGGSDVCDAQPTIEDYASAMAHVMDDLSAEAARDVLGFHTGCLVAAELCGREPNTIANSVLIDIPAFDEETGAKLKASNGTPLALTPTLDCLAGPWESGITKRLPSQPMGRAFEMFVEQIRPGAAMNAAFYAAFSYRWREKFEQVNTNTLVLASQSPLLSGSRDAAEIIPNAMLVECLDITRSVLDEAAEKTAAEVMLFLEGATRRTHLLK